MRLLFSMLAVSLLFGCASSPTDFGKAKQIKQSNILDSSYSVRFDDYSKITIKRDSGFTGSGCSSRIYVDGNKLADLDVSEFFSFYLPSGNHIISAHPNGLCGGGMFEVGVTVDKNESLNYRIGYGSSGDYFIVPTAF
ncbi:hypothetical protein [Vibrio anguillarum]|uniref:Lipoprotein n=4 Tax=Vibrio anguillarum TaxID=55601 RepID=A0A241NGX9_VIBAN|nr:hypothetical protein [Vibrio anguillarum]AOT26281.1 putative lipoprotein [Vibrio phage Her]AOT26372.1 putative lipoprotein [Vibrio phage Cla]AOT26554.1 putative lipoprotein [Vibrio phage Pel]AOT26645.1 putative lipoprotein [Vibrio phage pVa-2]AOT26736.1 putative lipoprotein [Vibrio phage pVa-1]AOT26827.1 putative lipoprotein [Vibrio phage vB_VspP_pVa5_12Jun]AOT26918.1 putative lipoprotein [Vibrio phage pVa-6]AOT27012.1 putative lipoprotein [Vibrio phage VaK]AOT27105.1 putative lipoprote